MGGQTPSRPWAGALQDVLRAELARAAGQAAVRQGLITEAQLTDAAIEAEANGVTLTSVLIDRGRVDLPALALLENGIAREDFLRSKAGPGKGLPPEAEEAAADPARRLAEFLLVAPIARGATGEIWKAWDRTLSRWVAVKISTVFLSSESARDRFHREAVAAGRLSHPHIAPIHRLGFEGEKIYLVMPFIDGQTAAAAELPVRRALEVIHVVALAVEHAHRQGVVHRDLKPANIMIDRSGGVFVVDFGLAYLHQEQSLGLTHVGDVVGTAGFMSPEQARGDPRSRLPTTDVYGLGATLYFLLTGAPPFAGETLAAVVREILEEDPVPPRRLKPGLDAHVETVVLKALAKDPRRRYPSAEAFAEDVGRILAGQSITARSPRWGRKLLGRLGRRRLGVVILGGALALALAVIGLGQGRVNREKDAALDSMRAMARVSLETGLRLRRAGDVAGMKQVLPNLVRAYEEVRRRGASNAETEYLMGRMYRALMAEDDALAHQQEALKKDPDYPPALYERAVLLSRRYGRQLGEVLAQMGRPLRNAQAAIETEAARPELVELRLSVLDDGARLRSLSIGEADADAIAGILAYHRRQYSEAAATLEKLVVRDPLREEVWETLIGTARAQNQPARAEEVSTAALARDRGYLPHLVARCGARSDLHRWTEAAADAGAALGMDPGLTEAYHCRAFAQAWQVAHERTYGADLRAPVAAAIADFDQVLVRRPDSSEGYWGRGFVRWYRAEYADMRSGRDPMADLAGAEKDLTRAIDLGPRFSARWGYRGWVRLARATYRRMRGEDPSSDCAAAEADFAEARAREPGAPYFPLGRADTLLQRALYKIDRGDPAAARQDLLVAEEEMKDKLLEELKTAPLNSWMFHSRGVGRLWQGHVLRLTGGDPLAPWTKAETDFADAIQTDPADPDARIGRALLRIERGSYRQEHRTSKTKDVNADFAAAAGDLDRALALYPGQADAWMARGDLARARGDGAGAQTAYHKALALNPFLDRQVARKAE